jgi:hypothetical protein
MKTIQSGITTLMVVIFLGIFLTLLAGLSSFSLEEERYGQALIAREQAFNVAESGVEYYRWFLAHNPNNLTNGTSTPGPYPYTLTDPQTNQPLGTSRISVSGKMACGQVQWVDISATGTSVLDQTYKRSLFGRYMKPSMGSYAYMENSNTWETASTSIIGPYYSNGGIRMDGTNNSDVVSAKSTWNCTALYGCSNQTKPGIFGTGPGSALWHFPAPSVDFSGGIALSLSTIKTVAQGYGLYFATSTGTVGQRGYHFIFKSDGTVDVYGVTSVVPGITGQDDGSHTIPDYSVIQNQTLLGNYSIPPSCRVIFANDNIWVEGVVKDPIIIAAADYLGTGAVPNVYLPGNITYTNNDGTSGLTVISDGNVYIPLNSPDFMELHGIFIAHNGEFGRKYYDNTMIPFAYRPYILQSQLTIIGSIASNLLSTTDWQLQGSPVTVSGYSTRIDSYDELQALAPPPFTPASSANFQIVNWDER